MSQRQLRTSVGERTYIVDEYPFVDGGCSSIDDVRSLSREAVDYLSSE